MDIIAWRVVRNSGGMSVEKEHAPHMEYSSCSF